ncbi:MAG: hypothetical protein IJD68_02480 [Ruminococcus sp.]|nr:hypothetical protein [Ruminococcus sp.]
MSEFNFDKLKNLDIPQSWVDSALDVPKIKEKSPVVFINFRRVISAVAILLVVCVVCLSPLFFKNSNDILPIASNNPTEQTNSSQYDETTKTEAENNTDATEKIETQTPTRESKTNLLTESTEKSTDSPTQAQTEKVTPTKKPQSEPIEDPSGQPSNPNGSVLPDGPEGETDAPGAEGDYGNLSGIVLEGFTKDSCLTGSGNVYCSIYEYRTGSPTWSGNLYVPKFEADIEIYYTPQDQSDRDVYLSYNMENSGLLLKPGKYRYYFVNENGTQLYTSIFSVSK